MGSRRFLVPILLPADPTAALEAATKQYVDNRLGGQALPVGAVVDWDSDDPIPSGWLEANGIAFSAGTYPELAAIYEDNKTPLRYDVPRFATTAERDAYYTAPVDGIECYVGDSRKANWRYINGAWLPFDNIWQAYSPILSTDGTQPSLGTAAWQLGKYFQQGKLVQVKITIKFGTSPTIGTGNYYLSLPVSADISSSNLLNILNPGSLFDSSAGTPCFAQWYIASATTVGAYYPSAWPTGSQVLVSATAPWAWATGDEFKLNTKYEAA